MMPGTCVRALRAACLADNKARGRVGHRAACGRVQASDQVLQTRVVHLPVAFNDKWTNDAIAKYMKSVRPAAEHVHPPGLAHPNPPILHSAGLPDRPCLLGTRERPLITS